MIASFRHKFITIDIPKTGTRSIRETLAPLKIISILGKPDPQSEFYQHDTLFRIKKQFDLKFDQSKDHIWDWSKYFKFTVVRNPWTRFFSKYNYLFEAKKWYLANKSNPDADAARMRQGKVAFGIFETCRHDNAIMKRIIKGNGNQERFFAHKGNVYVDHVARFERLEEELNNFFSSMGIKETFKLKHSNKGNYSKTMQDVFDQEIVDLIAETEKFVIDTMNYDYDNCFTYNPHD